MSGSWLCFPLWPVFEQVQLLYFVQSELKFVCVFSFVSGWVSTSQLSEHGMYVIAGHPFIYTICCSMTKILQRNS